MKFVNSLSVLTSVLVLGTAHAFNVTSVGIIGTGCKPGTFSYEIGKPNPAPSVLSAYFSNFTALTANGLAMSEARKSCAIVYSVAIAPNEQIALEKINANIAYGGSDDAMLTLQSMYHLQGDIKEAYALQNIKGPIKDSTLSLNLNYAPQIFTPCGLESVVISAQIDAVSSNSPKGAPRPGAPESDEQWGLLSIVNVKGPTFISRKC